MSLGSVLGSYGVLVGCSLLMFVGAWTGLDSSCAAQEVLADTESKLQLGLLPEQPAEGPFVKIDGGFRVPYKATIPGTDTTFEMVPVPGGTFTMGSPENEKGRQKDEGPQFEVVVKPFWMGKYEVTWDEYKRYMDMEWVFRELQRQKLRRRLEKFEVDAVSAPSSLYDERIHYGAGGKPDQPAATMTQFGAKQYTKWLSLTSGQFYRLPYEAEWEYACRAGTNTAFSFGNDMGVLKDHAWFEDNADEERHVVGQKKPNAFGLFDMHGNVAEWVLDAYDVNGYTHLKAGQRYTVEQTFNKPKTRYSRVVRGGSWEMQGLQCRSAARLASDVEWQDTDPVLPKGSWWHTDTPALGVGFRIVRPFEVPQTMAAKNEFWKPDLKYFALQVLNHAVSSGRGAIGTADEKLPEQMKKILDELAD